MNAMTSANASPARGERYAYELRFNYLDHAGRAVVFPCDQQGVVDVNALSPQMSESYQRARQRVGRDLAHPAVRLHGPARGAAGSDQAMTPTGRSR